MSNNYKQHIQDKRTDDGQEKYKCYCGNWFTKRGFAGHVSHCDDKPQSDGSESNNDNSETLQLKETCPDCGAELATIKVIAKAWRRKGHDQKATQLEQAGDYGCTECDEGTVVVYSTQELKNKGGKE